MVKVTRMIFTFFLTWSGIHTINCGFISTFYMYKYETWSVTQSFLPTLGTQSRLCDDKQKKVFFVWNSILSRIKFCPKLRFVRSYMLSEITFCPKLHFVQNYILSENHFVRNYILSKIKFCPKLRFVQNYVLSKYMLS